MLLNFIDHAEFCSKRKILLKHKKSTIFFQKNKTNNQIKLFNAAKLRYEIIFFSQVRKYKIVREKFGTNFLSEN